MNPHPPEVKNMGEVGAVYTRIGICWDSPERFYWDASNGEPCPGCSNHPEDTANCKHTFYALEPAPHSPEQEDGGAVFIRDGDEGPFTTPFDTAPPGEQVDAGWTLWREKGEGWRLDQGELNSGLMGDVERVEVVRASERDNWRAAARGSAKRVASLWNRAQAAESRCAELETALREIAGVWPGEIGAEPKEDWRKTRARAALSPIPSEREGERS